CSRLIVFQGPSRRHRRKLTPVAPFFSFAKRGQAGGHLRSGRCPGQTELTAQPFRSHRHYSFQAESPPKVLLLFLRVLLVSNSMRLLGNGPPSLVNTTSYTSPPRASLGGVPRVRIPGATPTFTLSHSYSYSYSYSHSHPRSHSHPPHTPTSHTHPSSSTPSHPNPFPSLYYVRILDGLESRFSDWPDWAGTGRDCPLPPPPPRDIGHWHE
ncbi:hypothetical protein CTA2_12999, partial [Colletotrichum tanaceti]